MKFILRCVTLDLSDNLTEMRLKDLTWKTQMCHNKTVFSVSCVCGTVLESLFLTQGSSTYPFENNNIFVTEFSEFSENI